MIWFLIHTIAIIWGWLSRMCGGAPPRLPFGLDQWLYALPYLAAAFPVVLAYGHKKGSTSAALKFLAVYVATVSAKRTGHGGGIDAGTSTKFRADEKLEFFIKPLRGKISEYWYDIILLGITGLAVSLPAGIVLSFADMQAGLLIALSGGLKAPAYMVGWLIYPAGHGRGIPYLNEATAIGEFLTGYFCVFAFLSILEITIGLRHIFENCLSVFGGLL